MMVALVTCGPIDELLERKQERTLPLYESAIAS